ncbi:5328_t:CDS:2, partial [Racocetra fulgida]
MADSEYPNITTVGSPVNTKKQQKNDDNEDEGDNEASQSLRNRT